MESKDLLNSYEFNRPLEYASVGQRFLNYIFDIIFLYIVTFIIALSSNMG